MNLLSIVVFLWIGGGRVVNIIWGRGSAYLIKNVFKCCTRKSDDVVDVSGG